MDNKVGRNDPCPCGSGKKYKNCCYGKEIKKTYTPEGKRKFKAKLLSGSGTSLFQPPQPGEAPSMDKLKLRFASSDFRVKESESKAEPLPFTIPHDSKDPTPSEKKPLASTDQEFKPASEDFREKKEE